MENRTTVKIYGQEYIIAGDKGEEEIQRIAGYVDDQMRTMSKFLSEAPAGSLAVLASVNIAEQYFDMQRERDDMTDELKRLRQESAYYTELWEKSKDAKRQSSKATNDLKDQIREQASQIKELEAKCTEYENNYFDLQMENIQLKSELEKWKVAGRHEG